MSNKNYYNDDSTDKTPPLDNIDIGIFNIINKDKEVSEEFNNINDLDELSKKAKNY